MSYSYLYRAINKVMQPQKQASTKMQVYVEVNGQQAGPFTKTELTQLIKNGTLTAETLVWEAGMANWAQAATMPNVNKLLILNAPKRKATGAPKPQAASKPEPKAPHPLRADLINAMSQLGFKGADIAKSVDALLAEQPDITSAAALKILLKQ